MKITLLIMSTLFTIDFLLVSATLTEENFSVEALCSDSSLVPLLVYFVCGTSWGIRHFENLFLNRTEEHWELDTGSCVVEYSCWKN